MKRNRLPALTTLARRMAALQAGTAAHIPSGQTLLVGGEALPAPEIVLALGTVDRLCEQLQRGQVTLADALARCRELLPGLAAFVADYARALRAHLGADNPSLLDFGLRPARRGWDPRNLAMLPKGARLARRLRNRPRGQPATQAR